MAYANAGITNLNDTQYLECHGTGTQAGDPTEVRGAAAAFAAARDADRPLIIGSVCLLSCFSPSIYNTIHEYQTTTAD